MPIPIHMLFINSNEIVLLGNFCCQLRFLAETTKCLIDQSKHFYLHTRLQLLKFPLKRSFVYCVGLSEITYSHCVNENRP